MFVRFLRTSLPNVSQHGGNKLYYGKLRCPFEKKKKKSHYFCQLIELSHRIKIIFNEQRLSYINIRLTNVKFCSGVSS